MRIHPSFVYPKTHHMNALKKLLFVFTVLGFQFAFSQGNRSSFSRDEVLEDLDYLYRSLEETHYDLYAYTSKQEIQKHYDLLRKRIHQDSLSIKEITGLFQTFTAKVNNGHTEIIFPVVQYLEYAEGGGTLFPLELVIEDGKALVRNNLTPLDELQKGTEILSIDGTPIMEVFKKLSATVSAERPYFKYTKAEIISFPRLYWQVYGSKARYEVVAKVNGEEIHKQIEAVPALDGFEMKRWDILINAPKFKQYKKVAYLNPGDFGGDLDQFKSFIDSAFTQIRTKKSPTLIIDLRFNRGGDDVYSDYLVSYIADKPFQWNSSFELKSSAILKKHVRDNSDLTTEYAKSILGHKDGERFSFQFESTLPQPKNKRYNGKVYVLVNRQSHSQSAVTAAQIQDYGFGKIVGEETGDSPSLYASQLTYTLPITGIPVKTAKGKITRVNGSEAVQGVQPDIFIRDHLRDDKDEILEGLLAQLEAGRP